MSRRVRSRRESRSARTSPLQSRPERRPAHDGRERSRSAARESDGWALIEISDTGSGIPYATNAASSTASTGRKVPTVASAWASRSPARAFASSGARSGSNLNRGVGTTVRIRLPLGRSQAGCMSPRILIVDDEPSLVRGLAVRLRAREVRGNRRSRRRRSGLGRALRGDRPRRARSDVAAPLGADV